MKPQTMRMGTVDRKRWSPLTRVMEGLAAREPDSFQLLVDDACAALGIVARARLHVRGRVIAFASKVICCGGLGSTLLVVGRPDVLKGGDTSTGTTNIPLPPV